MNLRSICTRLNQYLIDSEDLYWRNWVGLQDDIDIAGLSQKTGDLFSLETIGYVRNLLKQAKTASESHRLRSILGQLTLSFMENQGADTQQKVLNREAATMVSWKGEEIPLRTFRVRTLNEPDRDRRKQMIEHRESVVEKEINPLKLTLLNGMFESVRQMGYANYIELCQETQNRDFRQFASEMEQFLSDTESVYREHLDYYLNMTTGKSLDDSTHSADLTAVMRCNIFDAHFPSDQLVPTLKQTVGGMGYGLDKIHLDLEDRPNKKPRPCVSAVNPPEDVRLTIYPVGGYEDYSGLLHETGHALHFIHETPQLDFIHKYWGDRGFTEGTAYLFQNITLNPVWLKTVMKLRDIRALQKYTAFMGILRFRRLIGQFLYLMDLFETDNPESVKDKYLFHLERAHQVKFDASNYLTFDMELYSAGYIRARMFELQLRNYLIKRFDENWWQKPDTGNYLNSLFVNGRMNRADDVVKDLGYNSLDPDYYRENYLSTLLS